MKTTPVLRAQLERAAEESGRPLTQEVEARLIESFASEELWGGPEIKPILKAAGQAAAGVIAQYQAQPSEDLNVYFAIQEAISRTLRNMLPHPDLSDLQDEREALERRRADLEDMARSVAAERITPPKKEIVKSGLLAGTVSPTAELLLIEFLENKQLPTADIFAKVLERAKNEGGSENIETFEKVNVILKMLDETNNKLIADAKHMIELAERAKEVGVVHASEAQG